MSATWGARCGKSARRVLRGGTGARSHAGSVRTLPRKRQLQRGSGKATAPRPVPTSHNLDKGWMIKFVGHRVADPRILRLIQKWLKAGVMEEGQWSEPQTGTTQGSVISPLLANVYLHYSFDLWVNVWRQKWAKGEVVVIRYADDNIAGFQYQTDADRFLENLRERLAQFGLELHPDKTRRIEFGRFAEEKPET